MDNKEMNGRNGLENNLLLTPASIVSESASPISDNSTKSLPLTFDSVKFQLIPISETVGKSAFGVVLERSVKEKDVIKIGRLIQKDGQTVIKGSKKATELDIWFTSKVVSRLHAEIWLKDNQLYIKDVGSSSGTFLNHMRLSPPSKVSRPYVIKQGDVLQFGIDFKGKENENAFCAIKLKIGFYDQEWIKAQKKLANPSRFTVALKQLIAATNPYGESKDLQVVPDSQEVECCICIGPIAPYQALFVAPCSHCYHYKCVSDLIAKSLMFQCPLCRQVANLTASVSCDSLSEKINIPLPQLESADEKLPVQHSTTVKSYIGNAGFAAGKKFLETLGLLSPKAITESDGLPTQDSSSSPISPSPPTVQKEEIADEDSQERGLEQNSAAEPSYI